MVSRPNSQSYSHTHTHTHTKACKRYIPVGNNLWLAPRHSCSYGKKSELHFGFIHMSLLGPTADATLQKTRVVCFHLYTWKGCLWCLNSDWTRLFVTELDVCLMHCKNTGLLCEIWALCLLNWRTKWGVSKDIWVKVTVKVILTILQHLIFRECVEEIPETHPWFVTLAWPAAGPTTSVTNDDTLHVTS